MSAYELADSLEAASSDMEYNYHVSDWKLLYESAIVLRKQAERIEVLEKTHLHSRNIEKKLWKLIREQEMKIINLSFDLAYAQRSDEWKELNDKKENSRV